MPPSMTLERQYQTNPPSSTGPPVAYQPDDDEAYEENIFRDMSFDEVLEDLNARFLVNLPEEELSLVRVYWQAEQAHWFYEDYLRPLNPLLPSLSQRQFTHLIISSNPLYASSDIDYDDVWEEYCTYKKMVPCCGGILINQSHDMVLMVRGWKSNAGWCFPRGKINSNEPEVACAIREVEEETGFDMSELVDPKDFIKSQVNAQEITMFIVDNVDESTVFETQTRKEIGAIEWVPLADLPTWTHKRGPKRTGGKGQKKFYNVTPFVGPLKKWLGKHGYNTNPRRPRDQPPPKTVGRELQPFNFDGPDAPQPTTAIDHLFAKFVQKDERALALESDTARNLDDLFGQLTVIPAAGPKTPEQQAQEQREDDDLTQLLSGATSPVVQSGAVAPGLDAKQSKLLAVLGPSKPQDHGRPSPSTPGHQNNLLTLLHPSQQLGSGTSHSNSAQGPTNLDDEDRRNRQKALLEMSFAGIGLNGSPSTPPRAMPHLAMGGSPSPYASSSIPLPQPQRLNTSSFVTPQARMKQQAPASQHPQSSPHGRMPYIAQQAPLTDQDKSGHQRALLDALFGQPNPGSGNAVRNTQATGIPMTAGYPSNQHHPAHQPHPNHNAVLVAPPTFAAPPNGGFNPGYQVAPPPAFGHHSYPITPPGHFPPPLSQLGSQRPLAPPLPGQSALGGYDYRPPPPPGLPGMPYPNHSGSFGTGLGPPGPPPGLPQPPSQMPIPQPTAPSGVPEVQPASPWSEPQPSSVSANVHQPVPRPPVGGGLLGLMGGR